MKFVVKQDSATGLWHWELRAAEGGPIARSEAGFRTLEELVARVQTIRVEAPRSLVFDLLGKPYEGI
ncbi:MAG: hypothetical protein EOO24_34745 [Comamonadaceae bacterium]|nr:MAG: hypothetical protein EOO24_34745 [Comamonadaceae bacterium]